MAKNDRGCGAGVDRDSVSAKDVHVSDVAGATVDGERGGDGNRAVSTARQTVDLDNVDRSLKCGARGSLAAGVAVDAVWADPQHALRLN
jgi:hypothetical protein